MCDAIIICRRKKKVFSRSQTFTSSRNKDIIIIESSNTTRSDYFWREENSVKAARCETTKSVSLRAKIEEETFTCQRYVYIMYKTRKKNIGKANKKTTDKNSFLCALKKNKHFSHKKEVSFSSKKKRTSDAIILSTLHTQRQQQQQ